MNEASSKSLDDIALAHSFQLEELLDGTALVEMTRSFEQLFGVPLRIYSASGALMADAERIPQFYSLLNKSKEGSRAVQKVISQVRGEKPTKGGSAFLSCISGGEYLISAIVHEGRSLGHIILGPFLSPELRELPERVRELAVDCDLEGVMTAWESLPRLSRDDSAKLDRHMRATLDLLVFSGLKAHLASNMHMASVQESFRELSDKNKKLQHAYDRLKELDRLKSNFLATVSHELRTPLTSIIGYSEMLIEGIAGELLEEQRDFVQTIHEKGEQLLELIKSLLDLSKLESGTMSLRRTSADCGGLVEEVVATLTPVARKREVHLVAEVASSLPSLHADVDRLRQVLNNLCENALKFTPSGGTVTVTAKSVLLAGEDLGGFGSALMAPAQRPAIQLSVSDTGIGIPESERSRVFDAFYQVDSSSTREVGGTGLGLSIVKRLVDAHDGEIHVEANDPEGSRFVVTLPILKH